jgi:predicted molibdopterin-dependent oxidoreductase YjgC
MYPYRAADEGRPYLAHTPQGYCGVGWNLTLHVQENRIVKVTSPIDHDVTRGHLCVKGRFGFEFVQNRETPAGPGEGEGDGPRPTRSPERPPKA